MISHKKCGYPYALLSISRYYYASKFKNITDYVKKFFTKPFHNIIIDKVKKSLKGTALPAR